MGGEWREMPFADVIELISGGTPKTSVSEYWGGSIPWLSVSDFNTGFRWVSTAEKTITERGLAESATTILNQGDIIISARGTVGALAQLAKPMAFNQSCYGVRGKIGIAETDFIYYALRHAVSQMQQVAHGGVFNTITKDTFKIITTKLPPIKHQCAIAHILGTLDDKIELNRRMNQTLEEMARAIFKSWFVDFDPVRAKAAVRREHPDWSNAQVSRAACPNLKPEIAELFPDEFENSELGEIPKGWRVGRLGDLVENVIERIQPSSFTESHPYVPIECIEARSVCLINWQPGRNAKSSLVRFYKGDIIFGAMRPYFHKVCIAPFDGTTRTTAFVLRPVPSELAFTAFAVSRDETIDYATAHSEGSTIPYAKWAGSLQDMKIIIPMQNMREAYHRYIWPFIERMRTNLSANTLLAALRDALLPKLISCELRVKDAKKIVGRAL